MIRYFYIYISILYNRYKVIQPLILMNIIDINYFNLKYYNNLNKYLIKNNINNQYIKLFIFLHNFVIFSFHFSKGKKVKSNKINFFKN